MPDISLTDLEVAALRCIISGEFIRLEDSHEVTSATYQLYQAIYDKMLAASRERDDA